MNCRNVVKELSSYLEEDLDPTLQSAIERHLSNCDDCRLVVDTTKKTIQIFCNAEPAALPADTKERLHQALEKRLRRQHT